MLGKERLREKRHSEFPASVAFREATDLRVDVFLYLRIVAAQRADGRKLRTHISKRGMAKRLLFSLPLLAVPEVNG